MTRTDIIRRVTLILMALALSACGRAEGVLLPVSDPPTDARKVDMLVATTRAPSPDPGVVFTGERGETLSFANVVVSIPPDREVGSIQWPRQGPGDPAHEFAVTALSAVPPSEVSPWFRTHSTGKRRVLVFVHGFNTRFDASVFRFAQIVHDTKATWAPVLFSWPSRGRALDYVYDRESTNFSRSDLADVLRSAAQNPSVDEIVVMAHSMGAWLAVEALRQMALEKGMIPKKITNVILASPDLDVDVFNRQLEDMGSKRPHIYIFVSRNDQALRVSRLIAGNVNRVGALDLTQEPYKSRLQQLSGLTVIDTSDLRGGDRLQHSQFATTPELVQLLGIGLMSEDRDQNNAVSGADAVQMMGNTVGALVSAPISIFVAGMPR